MNATRAKITDFLEEDACFLDPEEFDDAIIGISYRIDMPPVVAYDLRKCVEIIQRLSSGDMTVEEAEEYFEFNTMGCWMGDFTPVFVDTRWAE